LSLEQLWRLASELEKGALEHGYPNDYWTLDRIGKLIWDLHGVRYHPSGVWDLMGRLGWSNQKPQRQPLQRDDEAIAAWKREVWPEIKKVADPARHPDFRRRRERFFAGFAAQAHLGTVRPDTGRTHQPAALPAAQSAGRLVPWHRR
jgi:hypothetical protein